MKPIIILSILATMALSKDYRDQAPNRIIKEDVETLKDFDNTLYGIADKGYKIIDTGKIYRYISKHRAMINDYSPLKVLAVGEIGSRTRRTLADPEDNYSLVDEVSNSREYYAIAVKASYPLYDKKTEKNIRNERINQENNIIDIITSYADSVAKLEILHEELKIVRLIQIRDKAQVKTGIKYLDERIKTIERLHKVRANIAKESINKRKLKYKLLALTTHPSGLEELL